MKSIQWIGVHGLVQVRPLEDVEEILPGRNLTWSKPEILPGRNQKSYLVETRNLTWSKSYLVETRNLTWSKPEILPGRNLTWSKPVKTLISPSATLELRRASPSTSMLVNFMPQRLGMTGAAFVKNSSMATERIA